MSETDRDIRAKVAMLETQDHALSESLAGLSKRMEDGFDAITRKIESVSDRSRITWPLIISTVVCGVGVVSLVGAIGSLVIAPVQANQKELEADLKTHVNQDGHKGAMILHATHAERFKTLEQAGKETAEAVKGLDIMLQREMRLLDQTQSATIEGLDTRLQTEMRLLDRILEKRLDGVEQRLKMTEASKTETLEIP